MKIAKLAIGFLIILLFWMIGSVVSTYLIPVIPGSVVGMLLLFFALSVKLIKSAWVKDTAQLLTKNMSLFFIPAGVGIMAHFNVLKEGWQFILIASTLSTIAVMVVVAGIQQVGEKDGNNRGS